MCTPQVAIVGGSSLADSKDPLVYAPVCEVWDPATPDTAVNMTTTRAHPAGFDTFMTWQYYPFIVTLPRGAGCCSSS